MRLLVVEDSDDAFMLVRRALEPKFELLRARNLFEAEGVLDRFPFDLILLDLTLPDGDGLNLLAALQSQAVHQGFQSSS
jgi:DNA-binding response OmpR family regulator